MTTEIILAMVPVGLALFAGWNNLNRKMTEVNSRVEHLESNRDEVKSMIGNIMKELQEIKILLARNQVQ
jgi:outer membrane murein-binding lipoprotein Lpp